jgi:hypothetical protein
MCFKGTGCFYKFFYIYPIHSLRTITMYVWNVSFLNVSCQCKVIDLIFTLARYDLDFCPLARFDLKFCPILATISVFYKSRLCNFQKYNLFSNRNGDKKSDNVCIKIFMFTNVTLMWLVRIRIFKCFKTFIAKYWLGFRSMNISNMSF